VKAGTSLKGETGMTELLKTIRERKSVRTFDGEPVSAEDREKIEQYIRTIENPFGEPFRVRVHQMMMNEDG
jgi:hypothetical protein